MHRLWIEGFTDAGTLQRGDRGAVRGYRAIAYWVARLYGELAFVNLRAVAIRTRERQGCGLIRSQELVTPLHTAQSWVRKIAML